MNNNANLPWPRDFLYIPAKPLLLTLGLLFSNTVPDVMAEEMRDTAAFENDNPEEAVSVAERDLFNLGASTLNTSDDDNVRTYSLTYRNHRREWFWPWQETTSRDFDWGIDIIRSEGEAKPIAFRSTHLRGILGGYLAPGVYLQGQAGNHALTTDSGDRTIVSNGMTARLGQGSNVNVELATSMDLVYPQGAFPGSISQQLSARDYTVSVRLRPHQNLRLAGKGTYRKFSDDNFSRLAELSVLYGISPSWPWVWAGVGGQQLSFYRPDNGYWSPQEFKSYGLRFESSFPLSPRLSASAGANLDKLDEDGSEGTGYFLMAGLQYRLSGQLYARLEMNQSKSLQQASTWTSDSALFWLSGPLF